MPAWHRTAEYKLIYEFYRGQRAQRSGLPLINHIKEGVDLLHNWNRPEIEVRAFCLHPLVQNNLFLADPKLFESYPLAVEYAQKANAYLYKPENDLWDDPSSVSHRLGDMSIGCAWMLLADKVQNQKDFRIHHWFSHPRRHQLEHYFNLWIETLRAYYLGDI
jgi:hypothetical protein